jgi:IS5 family transposase
LEQALCVRIDFLQFCGLSLSDAIRGMLTSPKTPHTFDLKL